MNFRSSGGVPKYCSGVPFVGVMGEEQQITVRKNYYCLPCDDWFDIGNNKKKCKNCKKSLYRRCACCDEIWSVGRAYHHHTKKQNKKRKRIFGFTNLPIRYKRCDITKITESCEGLRKRKLTTNDTTHTTIVTESTNLYSTEFKHPIFSYTMKKDIGYKSGFLQNWYSSVLPIHYNNVGNKRQKRLGTPMKRGTTGDFKNDMKNCCYVVGNCRDKTPTAWNTKTEKHEAVRDKCFKMAKLLSTFCKTNFPDMWERKKRLAEELNIPLIPGTNSTATVISFNYQSVFHVDEKDKAESILVVVKPQGMKGGWLVFPEYNLSFPLNNGDILIFHGRKDIHGTSPYLFTKSKGFYRIGYVMYL